MTVTVYGSDWCGDCRRAKATLERLGVDFTYLDLATDEALVEEAKKISGRSNIPVVVYPDGSHDVEPSAARLQEKLVALGLAG